jgi:hypothetical protein
LVREAAKRVGDAGRALRDGPENQRKNKAEKAPFVRFDAPVSDRIRHPKFP